MVASSPIGDVGRTLRALLLEGMTSWSVDDDQIALVSPAQFDGDGAGLSLHLYRVIENAHWANERPGITGTYDPSAAPLVLELSYLLTAHPADSDAVETADTLEQHRMLSAAIRTFREHATVDDPDLIGSLAGGPALQLSVEDADDRVHDVWSTFADTPYLPSVSYRVTPVVIEPSTVPTDQRVLTTRVEHGTYDQEESP